MIAAKIKIISAMLIWGSLGIFAVLLGWPPPIVASIRAIIGTIFGAVLLIFSGSRLDWHEIKKAFPYLAGAGICVGTNWILLFYGFSLTTIPIATLCYYMAPVYVLLASPLLFGEKLTRLRLGLGAIAFIGTGFVAGVAEAVFSGAGIGDLRGVFYALASGVLYASVTLLNKGVKTLAPAVKTLIQMAVASLAITPFALLVTDFSALQVDFRACVLLLILGFVHTGFAFHVFFSGVESLPAQTTALLSYIDPVSAIVLSMIILNQSLTVMQFIGGVMILGATLAGEYVPFYSKANSKKAKKL